MARRRTAEKHTLLPDSKYNNQLVAKLVNYVMREGKKGIAEKIVYNSLGNLQKQIEKTTDTSNNEQESKAIQSDDEKALNAFFKVLNNVKPKIEVKSRRVGGSNYQVPIEVREERQVCLALRWIVVAAKKRPGHSMIEKLSAELFDAYSSRGDAFKKKEDIHRMAEANRAFAHFVW